MPGSPEGGHDGSTPAGRDDGAQVCVEVDAKVRGAEAAQAPGAMVTPRPRSMPCRRENDDGGHLSLLWHSDAIRVKVISGTGPMLTQEA